MLVDLLERANKIQKRLKARPKVLVTQSGDDDVVLVSYYINIKLLVTCTVI